MMRPYEPYIPQTPGELVDQLGSMMLGAPQFIDPTGYFATNIATEFQALNGGLEVIRSRLGEARYQELRVISGRMQALFEADPDDVNGDTRVGRDLIDQMQQMLRTRSRRG